MRGVVAGACEGCLDCERNRGFAPVFAAR